MQSYPINLTAATPATSINIQGDNFVYESCSSLIDEQRIIVKPEVGNEIVLRPGQQFRLTQQSGCWFVRSYDGTSAIAGIVIIGSGEFYDSNTKNTFKFDSTSGAVPVQNEKLTTFVHQAAVSVGVAATALVSDATLKRLYIRNGHATAVVYIGGAGVTTANGAIKLGPGDTWIEEDAAGAAWYAISDTAATNVLVQGMK